MLTVFSPPLVSLPLLIKLFFPVLVAISWLWSPVVPVMIFSLPLIFVGMSLGLELEFVFVLDKAGIMSYYIVTVSIKVVFRRNTRTGFGTNCTKSDLISIGAKTIPSSKYCSSACNLRPS